METNSRFDFDAFTLVAIKDTSTHQVEVGTVVDGEHTFGVTVIRGMNVPNGNFLVVNVCDKEGVVLWTFKGEGFDGIGTLAHGDNAVVIALCDRGKGGKLRKVIPLSQFVEHRQPELQSLVKHKRAAAEDLGRDPVFTQIEETLFRVLKDAEHEQRRTEREGRIQAILARPKLTGYLSDGRVRYGVPALESEWPSLPRGTFVIRVSSVDGDTFGDVIEAFQVWKEPGKNPVKGSSLPVTKEFRPSPSTYVPARVKPRRSILVKTKKGGHFEVQLYGSMDDIRTAREQGLNSGTYVAVESSGKDGQIDVFAVSKEKVDTIGKCLIIG